MRRLVCLSFGWWRSEPFARRCLQRRRNRQRRGTKMDAMLPDQIAKLSLRLQCVRCNYLLVRLLMFARSASCLKASVGSFHILHSNYTRLAANAHTYYEFDHLVLKILGKPNGHTLATQWPLNGHTMATDKNEVFHNGHTPQKRIY